MPLRSLRWRGYLLPGHGLLLALNVGSLRCRNLSGVGGKPDAWRTSRKRRSCEGFQMPAVTNIPHGQRPASENLQGTKPWEGARIRRCPGAHYGDYMSVGEPQLSQPRGSIER